MATWIYIETTPNKIETLFDDENCGFHYYTLAQRKPRNPQNSVYKVEVRGFEDILIENRVYSAEGFVKKIGYEYEITSRPSFVFAIYTPNAQYNSVKADVKLGDLDTYAKGIQLGVSALRDHPSIYIYRKTTDRKHPFKLFRSLIAEQETQLHVPAYIAA